MYGSHHYLGFVSGGNLTPNPLQFTSNMTLNLLQPLLRTQALAPHMQCHNGPTSFLRLVVSWKPECTSGAVGWDANMRPPVLQRYLVLAGEDIERA